jgi:hypothetical protein
VFDRVAPYRVPKKRDISDTLAVLRQKGFEGWIMVDAWETSDPDEANVKGKQAIDRARA